MEVEIDGKKYEVEVPEGYRIVKSRKPRKNYNLSEERRKALSESAKSRPKDSRGKFVSSKDKDDFGHPPQK